MFIVYMKHGCYYFFEEKKEMSKVFPSLNTRDSTYKLPYQCFQEHVKLDVNLNHGQQTPDEGGKTTVQVSFVARSSFVAVMFLGVRIYPKRLSIIVQHL